MPAMSIDRRTRLDADVRDLSGSGFFADDFPTLAARNGPLAAAGLIALHGRPLELHLPDGTFTVRAVDGTLVVDDEPADDPFAVDLDARQFSDWAQQLRTFNAMTVAHELRITAGTLRDAEIWNAVWLALLEAWPVVDPDLEFLDRSGRPLDLQRAFTPDDDPDDVAHHLREVGYLHLRGWLDPADMDRIADDIDRALPSYSEGDGRSWWATTADGARGCVRLQHFVEHSPTTARVLAGDRWQQLRTMLQGDEHLVQGPIEGNCIEALVKPLGVVEGISDVPWHRDCNFGRHAYGCSGTIIGISVTAGTQTSGLLRAVAGSHRVGMPSIFAHGHSYLPVVALPTEAGDVTVHLSCTLHEAMPPLERPRKVMYTGFGLPPRAGDRTEAKRDIAELRERAYKLQSQPPSPVASRPPS